MLNDSFQLVPQIFTVFVANVRSHIDPGRKRYRRLGLLPLVRLGIEHKSQ